MVVFLPQVRLKSQNKEWEGMGLRGGLWVKPQKMEKAEEGSRKLQDRVFPITGCLGWGGEWEGMKD